MSKDEEVLVDGPVEVPKPEVVNEPATEKLDADAIEKAVMGEHIPAGEEAQPAPEPDIPGAMLWAMLWQTACGLLAGRRGKHWELTDKEAKMLGEATDPVAEKWLPDFEKGPEAALIITAAMIVSPRVSVDAQNRQRTRPKPPEPEEARV